MDSFVQLAFELVGGLGIFLLGMKNMSDGMQAVAGSSLRRMIGAVTGNRFLATLVGVFVTCVVQSSSITTVMVVGFVNSGVMALSQAIGVIMGANIGTTITGWILVLKIGKYGLPMLGAAAFCYLFSKSERLRYTAMAVMGVGMVFFGLELMKDACSIIKQMPDFKGTISDLGGPSANMYQMKGKEQWICDECIRPSCIWPDVCRNLDTDHTPLLDIYGSMQVLFGPFGWTMGDYYAGFDVFRPLLLP